MQAYKVLKNELYNFYQKEISLQENPKYPLLTKETFELLKIAHNRNFHNVNSRISSEVFNISYLKEFNEHDIISLSFFEKNKEKIQKHLKSSDPHSVNITRSLAVLANRYYSQFSPEKMMKSNFNRAEISDFGHRDDTHISKKIEELAKSEINYNPYIYRQVLLNSYLKKQSIIIDIDLGDETSVPVNPVTNRSSLSQILALPFINDEYIFFKTSSSNNIVTSILPSATFASINDIPSEILSLNNQIVVNVDYLKEEATKKIEEQTNSIHQVKSVPEKIVNDNIPEEIAVKFIDNEALLSKLKIVLTSKDRSIENNNVFIEIIERSLKDESFSILFFKEISLKLDNFLNSQTADFKLFSSTEYENIQNLLFFINNSELMTSKIINVMVNTLTPEQIFFLSTHVYLDNRFQTVELHKSIKNRTFKNIALFERLENSFKIIPELVTKFEESINIYLDQIENAKESMFTKKDLNTVKQSLLWTAIPFLKNKTLTHKNFNELINFDYPLLNPYLKTFYALPPVFISNPLMKNDISNYVSKKPLEPHLFNSKSSNFILTFLEVDFENSYKNWSEKLGQADNFNFLNLPLFDNDSDTFLNDVFSIISSKPDYVNFLLHSFRKKYDIEETTFFENGKTSKNLSNFLDTFYQLNNFIYLKCANNLNSRNVRYTGIESIDNVSYFENLKKENLYFFLEKTKKVSETYKLSKVFNLFSISQHIFDFHKINNLTLIQNDIDFIVKLLNEDFKNLNIQARTYNKYLYENEINTIFPLKDKDSNLILENFLSNSHFKENFYNGFSNNIFYINFQEQISQIFKKHYGEKILTILPNLLKIEDIEDFHQTFHSLTNSKETEKFNINDIQKRNEIIDYLLSINPEFIYDINEFNIVLDNFVNLKNLTGDESELDKQLHFYTMCLQRFPIDFLLIDKNSHLIISTFQKLKENNSNSIFFNYLEDIINNHNALEVRKNIYNENNDHYEKFSLQKEQEIKNNVFSPIIKNKILKF